MERWNETRDRDRCLLERIMSSRNLLHEGRIEHLDSSMINSRPLQSLHLTLDLAPSYSCSMGTPAKKSVSALSHWSECFVSLFVVDSYRKRAISLLKLSGPVEGSYSLYKE